MSGKYPNTFYRATIKALIKNDKGQILTVKENSDRWDLPGGGLKHNEAPTAGIARELLEEIGVSHDIGIGDVVDVASFWLDTKQAWLMYIVYSVTLPDHIQLEPGEGVTSIAFIDPSTLATSDDERERYLSRFI